MGRYDTEHSLKFQESRIRAQFYLPHDLPLLSAIKPHTYLLEPIAIPLLVLISPVEVCGGEFEKDPP